MDLSALESASKALEKSLDFWGWLLLSSTLLVVVGLILEYWREVEEFSTLIRWPMAQFPWEKFRGLVGGMIVTFGVGGELIFTYMASRVETKLRDNSHRIEATLTKEAGDAKASADGAAAALKEANQQLGEIKSNTKTALADSLTALSQGKDALRRAVIAESSLGKAESEAKNAQGVASNALTLARDASTEAVSAKNTLLQVEKDVARVEEKYAPRTLSKDKKSALIAALKSAPVRPDAAVELDSFIGATDGVLFGSELVDAINDPTTGWHARFGAQNAIGGNLKGVVLIVHDLKSVPPWTIFLQNALKVAGLDGGPVTYDGQPTGTVMIFVAPKN